MICITNDMPEVRSCVVPKQHTTVCNDITCPGCLPRQSSVGYLCAACFHKLQQVYATWADYAEALNPDGRLSSVIRAVQTERVGASTPQLGHVNVSATALALDERWSHLRSLVGHASILTWVNTKTGAADAVCFTRAASATYRSHPIVDRGRKLRRVRCPKCQQLTLVQKPPTEGAGLNPGAEGPKPARSLIAVECQNPTCAHVPGRRSRRRRQRPHRHRERGRVRTPTEDRSGMTRKPWATTAEATILTGRSARTIRRWLADPEVNIDVMIADDGKTRLFSTAGLMATEARKSTYLRNPTFGRDERQRTL